ncbi:hypothetical protein DBR17_05335 [Sphingomonas sp. HMWF008]|nr:hypothetical protein DBR17_05335 [Sphingomonas sp. HMWF008]
MSVNRSAPGAARGWLIGCLVVLGGVILFYAGIVLGRQQASTAQPGKHPPGTARASTKPLVRNVFSPSVIADPYVLDEQRKVVEALESACEHQRQNCQTARDARAYLDAHR